MIGQASRMHLKEDLRRIRCAVLLCLLAVLLLALPTAYLLVGNLRAPTSCSGQVRLCRASDLLPREEGSVAFPFPRRLLICFSGSSSLFMSFWCLREGKKFTVTFHLPYSETVCQGQLLRSFGLFN